MDVRHVGPYRLERLLGFGGMGEVHLAYDTVRERTVALKLLSEALSKDADYQRRFRRESHVAARLREPHVIPIHDYGEVDGQLFIDMRLVDGQNVREILSDGGAMPPERAVHLVGQVADALEAAHADGLVHRDIKPSNVLVTKNDFVYVVDFGIARSVGTARSSLTLTGVTVGTLDYMAPERFSRSDIDGRADVYSLACLLFECLTGTPPFAGDDLPSLMYAHLFDDPPRPSALVASLPAAMDAVIATGMAKGLDDRFSSPVELADAARAALGGRAAAVRRQAGGATRAGNGDAGSGTPVSEKPGADEPGSDKPGAEKHGSGSPVSGKPGVGKPGAGSAGSDERAPGAPDRPATAARASGAHRSAAPASAAPVSGSAGSGPAGSGPAESVAVRSAASASAASALDVPGSRAAAPAAAAVAAGAVAAGAVATGAGGSGPAKPGAGGSAGPASGAPASGAPASGAPASGAPASGPAGSGAPATGSTAPAAPATAAPATAAPAAAAPASGAGESRGQVTSANDLLGALGAVHVPGGSPLAADADPAFQPTAKPEPVAPPARAVAEPVTEKVALVDRTPAPPAQAPTPVTPPPAAQDGPTVMFATPAALPVRPARPAVREPEVRSPARRRGPLLTVAAVLVVAALVVAAGFLIGSGPSAPVANPLAVPPAEDHDQAPAVSIAVPTVRGSIAVGPTPGYMEIAPNGRFAYIANRDAGVVTVLDTAINRVTSAIPIAAGPPQFVAFSPDGQRAYVSIYNTERTVNLIAVLDTTTNTVLTTIPVGRRPFASATTPDGSRLYVPSHDDGRLDVIDTATNTVVAEIPVAPNPHWVAFAPDGSRLYAANHESNLVSVVDPADNSVVATIPVGTSPHSTTLSPDGTRAAVVNFDSSEVSVIDTATNTVVATVPVGRKPQDIAYSGDGRFLYTANVDADTISVIDTGTNQVTAVIPAGDGPTSVAVSRDGRTAYVTILNDGSVLMLDLTAT